MNKEYIEFVPGVVQILALSSNQANQMRLKKGKGFMIRICEGNAVTDRPTDRDYPTASIPHGIQPTTCDTISLLLSDPIDDAVFSVESRTIF